MSFDASVPPVNGVNDYCFAESGNLDFPCNATPIMVASFGLAAGGLGLLMVLFLNAEVRSSTSFYPIPCGHFLVRLD
jgi:hypothetical protein